MPPALDRLLARPSALRFLRSVVNASELPALCSTTAKCCNSSSLCRRFSNNKESAVKQKWRRWQDPGKEVVGRDKVRQLLEADGTTGPHESKLDTLNEITLGEWRRIHNDASWAATLARQERLNRLRGIESVWRLCQRQGYHLPTDETPDAAFLWGTFIKHRGLVMKIIDHAVEVLQKSGKSYPRLYNSIMSYWLPRAPREALEYHHQLLVKLKLRTLPLQELARLGRSTFRSGEYEVLMEMYRNSNERDLYDEVVPRLFEQGNLSLARRWHALCTFRNDLPSESVASHPVIRIFTAETSTMSKTDIRFEEKRTSASSRQPSGKYNQELMQRLLGRDTAPVRFDDSFTARMFATRTFSPASIIQGLSVVGINEIGPQAVLAMASRSQPIEELPKRFEELRAVGITLQGCVFSLALEKFAMEQKWQLVRSMLDSDQHPDVFGDAEAQRRLLEYYLDQEDFAQAQRTLAILTLFHNESSAESWNLLLQVYIRRSGPKHVMEVLQDMRTRKVMLTQESIIAVKGLLRNRQPGRKPVSNREWFDDLRFVTRVFVTILETGMGAISPIVWREIIRRFGLLGRFKELRRLILWLLCWYAPRSGLRFADLPKSPFLDPATAKLRAMHPEQNHYFHFPGWRTQRENPLHPLRLLFRPSLHQGLIIWGFRAGLLPTAPLEQSMFGSTLGKKHYRRRLLRSRVLRRLDWRIGLQTVVQLRDLGVNIHHHTVVKALQMQFIVMFGRGRSNKRENRVMEKGNTIPYARYVQEVNHIWGSRLFREPQLFGEGMVHEHLWHPRLRRKINRRASITLAEILGPDWLERSSETDTHSGDRPAEKDGATALEDLRKHFMAQANRKDAGSGSHGQDKTDIVRLRSNDARGGDS